jgi:hypothetical protein
MLLENLAALGIPLEDLPDIHLLVNFSFLRFHPSYTSSFISRVVSAIPFYLLENP